MKRSGNARQSREAYQCFGPSAAFAARSSSDIVESGVYELRIASRVVAKSGSDGNSRVLLSHKRTMQKDEVTE